MRNWRGCSSRMRRNFALIETTAYILVILTFEISAMFNLIVRSVEWTGNNESLDVARLFEYTEDTVADEFRADNKPLLDRLMRLPCLFMQEGIADQTAYVGSISRAKILARELRFDYSIDREVGPLKNNFIYLNRNALDITHDFEFYRNHWAIKDVDLYHFLLRNSRPRRQRPTVFRIDDHEDIQATLVSAMMPFSAAFNNVYQSIKIAVENAGLKCKRADDIWEDTAIIQDVVSLIDRSRVVICDCTGRNPNVFYEAGIAHTLGRDVVLITQNIDDVPFDLRHLRSLKYLGNAEGLAALSIALQDRIETIVGH